MNRWICKKKKKKEKEKNRNVFLLECSSSVFTGKTKTWLGLFNAQSISGSGYFIAQN